MRASDVSTLKDNPRQILVHYIARNNTKHDVLSSKCYKLTPYSPTNLDFITLNMGPKCSLEHDKAGLLQIMPRKCLLTRYRSAITVAQPSVCRVQMGNFTKQLRRRMQSSQKVLYVMEIKSHASVTQKCLQHHNAIYSYLILPWIFNYRRRKLVLYSN